MKNEISIKIINFISLLLIFCFLLYQLKYSVIINDDLMDILINKYNFFHGRYFSELISTIFIDIIPNFFKIPVQDFAIVSEGITKSLFFIILLILINKTFTKFHKSRTSFEKVLYPLSFLMIFSMLSQLDYIKVFDTMQTFMGYISPLIFFILFWLKLYDVYSINKQSDCAGVLNNKNLILLILYTIIITMGNEELNFAAFILLLFSLFNKSVPRKYVICSLIAMFITGCFVYLSNGFLDVVNEYGYNIKINCSFTLHSLWTYLKVFSKFILVDNIFLWIPYVSSIILILLKNVDSKNTKVIKYSLYSIVSFMLFFLILYFAGESYAYYSDENFKNYAPYWILYPAFLFGFKLFLYTNILYLLGHILPIENNKFKKNIVIIILLISSLLYIILNCKYISLAPKSTKRVLYMADKIAVEYFKQGKTAILPRDEIWVILPTINDSMPYDLESDAYKGKIYYRDEYIYLQYIEKIYNVNVDYGMMFKPYNEAMEDFEKIGGKFYEKELDQLKFSNIK